MSYEKLASTETRQKKAKEIYDKYIYVELLVMNTEVCKGVLVYLKGQGWSWLLRGGAGWYA